MNKPYIISNEDCQSINISDWVNRPMDIICNGFSVREVIYTTLIQAIEGKDLCIDEINILSQKITDALATKLRLKQGNL